jgi:hypothetical protein
VITVVTNLSVYCPALLAGDKTRAIQLRIEMRLLLCIITIRCTRQILFASVLGITPLDAAITVRYRIHMIPFVAGNSRSHHRDAIDFQLMRLLDQSRRATKANTVIRVATSGGNHAERVILNDFKKIGTFKRAQSQQSRAERIYHDLLLEQGNSVLVLVCEKMEI